MLQVYQSSNYRLTDSEKQIVKVMKLNNKFNVMNYGTWFDWSTVYIWDGFCRFNPPLEVKKMAMIDDKDEQVFHRVILNQALCAWAFKA